MFTKIVVPLDGSETGELALPYAEELAGILNSELGLIYVCETAVDEYRHMHQVYIEKIAEQVSEHIKAYHPGDVSFTASVKTEVLDGEPAEEITDYADKNDFRLIIMVSHGRSGIMPWPMGSTAFKIIQRTSQPVLLVRARDPSIKAGRGEIFSRILAPLDGSKAGEAALPYIKELAGKVKAEVTLLQVVEAGQHVHTVGGLDYVTFPEEEVDHLKTEAKQYLIKTSKILIGSGASIKCEVRTGHPAQEIIKYADETDAGLVAISTHGRSGVQRWISGSVAYKVLHGGTTPILLVRASGVKE